MDRILKNNNIKLESTYSNLPKKFFYQQYPEEVTDPKIVILNTTLAKRLGIDTSFLESSIPIAQAYSGHQFGYFTILGDGRAILLGEYKSKDGERLDIQLKGSGRTAYSRCGDGKAALGPMLREYIISEGMNYLGILTTHSLAVLLTGEDVIREEVLSGAILTRISKSHIRVGTFQFVVTLINIDYLKELANYTINRHFSCDYKENPYECLLNDVIKKQGYLIAKWQLVGFIADYTNTFLNLTIENFDNIDMLLSQEFKKWYYLWQDRLKRQECSKEEAKKVMEKNNPTVIPRNHRVEEDLDAAVKREDYSIIESLLEAFKNTYDYTKINYEYTKLPQNTGCKYKTYCVHNKF